MVLYHINNTYYRQFLTTKVKDDKKNANKGGAPQKVTEKRGMVRDDWECLAATSWGQARSRMAESWKCVIRNVQTR